MSTLGWVLLAGSLLGNLILLLRPAPAPRQVDAVSAAFEIGDGGTDSQVPFGSATSIDAGQSLSACENTRPPLQAEVAALSAELRQRLPMHRLFGLGEPNPEAEEMFRPVVDRILATALVAASDASAGNLVPHTLECRDIVCKLTFIENADTPPAILGKALGSEVELRNRVTALSYPQSRFTEDLATRTKVREGKVYWRFLEPDAGMLRPSPLP